MNNTLNDSNNSNGSPMSFFEKIRTISSILIALPFLVMLFGTMFAGQYKYLKNSQEIVLTDYEYIEGQSRSNIYNFGSSISLIKKNDTYYAIHYYYKNKVDRDFSPLPKDNTLYLPIHPRELKEGKGTKDNPIRVMNYGFESKKYVWDRSKHLYNIRKDFVHYRLLRHDIFGDWVYMTYVLILFSLCVLSLFMEIKNGEWDKNE